MDLDASRAHSARWATFEARIATVPPYTLAALCGAWIAVTDGIAPHPYIELWAATARSFPRPPPGIFLQTSPIGPGLAHVLRATDPNAFAALHLGIVVLAVMAMVAVVRRRFGDLGARLAVAALFASPLANVLLTWLGQPDPIVLGLGAVVAVASSSPVLLVGACGLAIAHAEQAVTVVVVLVAVRWALDDLDRRQGIALGVGVAAGVMAIEAFKHHYGLKSSRVGYAVDQGLGEFVDNFVATWHSVVLASFGATWTVVLLLGRHLDRRRRSICACAVLFSFSVAFVTLDTTRVFALVTFPLVIVLIGNAIRTLPVKTVERILAVVVLAGVLYPHIVVWDGATYISSVSRTIDWFRS